MSHAVFLLWMLFLEAVISRVMEPRQQLNRLLEAFAASIIVLECVLIGDSFALSLYGFLGVVLLIFPPVFLDFWVHLTSVIVDSVRVLVPQFVWVGFVRS